MNKKTQKGLKKQPVAAQAGELLKEKSFKKYYYILGLFTFFLFANSIGNDYNLDDNLVTRGNQLTSEGLSAIKEIFTSNYYSDAMGYAFGYRPMVHLSFALEYELFGEKPGAGHFINVLLFALSVVLFFKLLVKWMGNKNVLFAGVATVLFAVHPVHTEVVDSLKNRDELLAFLFVIWTGLAMLKYLDKGKLWSLISILLLFTMAMLSKKSVYPMAIILPAAIVLLKDVSLNKLLLITALLVVPAAVIGSELQLSRLVLMIALPLFSLAILYWIKSNLVANLDPEKGASKIKGYLIPMISIGVIASLSIIFSNVLILVLTVPFFVWLVKLEFEVGLVALIFLFIGIDAIWLNETESQLFPFLLGLGYLIYGIIQPGKVNIRWLILTAVTSIYFLIQNHEIGDLSLIVIFGVILVLLVKKPLLAVLLAAVIFVVAYYFEGINYYATLILLFSASWFVFLKLGDKRNIGFSVIVGMVVTLGFIWHTDFQAQGVKSAQLIEKGPELKESFVKNDNILKEGRALVYVENTLIEPHSKSEEIGTGFATLGEYFRLMTFPVELSFYYGFAKTDTTSLKNIWVWLVILIHLGMLVLAFFHIKKNPMITLGVFWYLLSILLFSNWIELVAGMVGERLSFTASAGFCILITGILFWIKPDLNFKKPGMAGLIMIGVMVLFAGRTIMRNSDWKNTLTLMGNDIEHLKNSSQANNMYAMNLMAETNLNKSLTQQEVQEMRKLAIVHFEKAVNIYPDYYNVYIDMARATLMTGDYQRGIDAIDKAIAIDPENQYSYYFSLSLLERTGDFETYLKHAEKLFELNENEESYGGLARGYFQLKDYKKSKEILLEGLKLYPDNEGLKYNLNFVEQSMK
jgi:hypothetical protein